MERMKKGLVIVVCGMLMAGNGLCAAEPAGAGVLKLPAIFSDEMVLQRECKAPVWGWAEPRSKVTVEFAGQKETVKAGRDGYWMVKLDPMPANSTPQVMTIAAAGGERKEIKGVLIGDVWLCSGQSNMAMTMDGKTEWLHIGGVANAKEEVRNSANPLIRQFYVKWGVSVTPANDCQGKWTTAATNTTAEFSATGYFFARELQKRLKIPVAIINSSYGGSVVENWMSREILQGGAEADYVAEMNANYDRIVNQDKYRERYRQDLLAWEKKYGVNDPAGAPGDSNQWALASADAADWKKVTFPATLEKAGYPSGGIIWFLKEFDIPEDTPGFGERCRLAMPGCNGSFAVYANGVQLPQVAGRGILFGKALKRGRNVIAIRIHSCSGQGGIKGGDVSVLGQGPDAPSIPLNGEWLSKAEAEFKPLPQNADKRPVEPAPLKPLHWVPIPAHFNTMIYPLIPYAIKGAAWYQGEGNAMEINRIDGSHKHLTERYRNHLQLLVKDWRQRFSSGAPRGDFPFYICQLPGYGPRADVPKESGWAEIREGQFATAREMPNVWIANLIDTCADGDLHPLNKQDVGYRLALVALANTYGFKGIDWSGPVHKSMKIKDGKVLIQFDHADGGLVAKRLSETYPVNMHKPEKGEKPLVLPSPNSEVQGFAVYGAVAGADGSKSNQWVWADAKVVSDSTVEVWSDKVAKLVAVRYAWADHPVCNLYNKAGLPAFPFRTDKTGQ